MGEHTCRFGKNRCQGPLACSQLFSFLTTAVAASVGVVLGFEWSARQDSLGRDVPLIELVLVTALIIFIAYIIIYLIIEYLRRIIDHRWLELFEFY